MLRKDVKLGFAIGGIMLAVVIVYVLVVPSGDKKTVTVANDDSQGKAQVSPGAGSSDGKTAEPETTTSANAPPADPSKIGTEQGNTNGGQAPTQTTGNLAGSQTAAQSGNQSGSTPASGTAASGGSVDWNKLLAEGSSSPAMMSETPTLDSKHPPIEADSTPAPSGVPASITPAPDRTASDLAVADSTSPTPVSSPVPSSDKATPDLSIDTASTPATQPAEAGQRTHIVQPGEMLTSIASAAYGDSRKWKHIAEANPNINPNRLAPGTKLVIPALKGSSETSARTAAAANLDSQTQYEVQPNDSLYRISVKLYGKADHVDKLYDANKDVIGSDPKRLKLNMILKLTDPPTTATR